MYVFISWVILVIGIWIFVSPWVLGYNGDLNLALIMFSGLLMIILTAIGIIKNKFIKSHPTPVDTKHSTSHWPTVVNVEKSNAANKNKSTESKAFVYRIQLFLAGVGLFVFAIGILSALKALGLSCIILGIVITFFSILLSQINTQAVAVKLFTRDGSVLMEASRIDWEEGCIVIKGKVLGSINTIAYFKPGEMWKSLSLIPYSLIVHLPFFLFQGWRENRRRSNNNCIVPNEK